MRCRLKVYSKRSQISEDKAIDLQLYILDCFVACWVICHTFTVGCGFFSKFTFSKNSFRNTIIVSNNLDPDQDRRSVGPDLGPNCLQSLSADDKNCSKQVKE